MTTDISRYSLRPYQHFTGVVRQQGRLPLDADENEAGDIANLLLRQSLAETICTKGSPDDGFRISNPRVAGGSLLFDIDSGCFYLAGVRVASAGMGYDSQSDWLTFPLDTPGPTIPAAGAPARTDLVWLEAWEQTVVATEDAELFERALGGADTTARQRVMARVRVLEDAAVDCPDAAEALAARVYPGGTLDPDGCQVISDARLTIGFTQLEPLEDLCRPSAREGFLGARNETFRIQVTSPGRFIWGRDNAAPLYRVQVGVDADGLRKRIVFLTLPRDEFGWPLAGMTVEVLRWGAQLANGEKTAEPTGRLFRVETGFDPAGNSILVSAEIPLAWETWFASPAGQDAINPYDEADVNRYFFLRVWTGGGSGVAVDNPMDAGNAVELGGTGLTATFTTNGMPGDYWIVSARPNTPTEVTPWQLRNAGGAPPVGPRRLLAPLALLTWDGTAPDRVMDCRHRFRPLCRIGGCCVVTVGDGRNSHGDVSSINEAINRLPPEGGEICIYPGDYEEHVVMNDKRNITITGCGRNTRWRGEPGRTEPLLHVRGCTGVIVRRIAMTGTVSGCVVAESGGSLPENLLLEDMEMTVSDAGAVAAFEVAGITIRRCRVTLSPMSDVLSEGSVRGRVAALFLSGVDITVEHCRIEATGMPDRLHMAAGGVHIGGGSERVIIRDNIIHGGNGHGITLGSVHYVGADGAADADAVDIFEDTPAGAGHYVKATGEAGYYGFNIYADEKGCIITPGTPSDEDVPEGTPIFPESAGLVQRVQVLRNDIAEMGYSGISTYVFAGLGRGGFSDAIAVETIEIAGNHITGCMINEIGATTPLLRQFTGWGGIALSICSDATIRDNLIAGNGEGSSQPIVGIFLALAEDVRIERNRIERNGLEPGDGQALAPGRRGGVVIGVAIGGVSTYGEHSDPSRAVDRPALMVVGNTVDAPGARALKAITLGPLMVLGNRLTGAGRSAFAANVFGSLVAAGLSISRIGGQMLSARDEIDLLDYVMLELLADVLGGDVVNLISLCVAEELLGGLSEIGNSEFAPQRLRGGEMMVNDNQISLQRHSPEMEFTLSSVLLLGADDISFCDNQAEIENEVKFALTDVLAVAVTLRVTGNRLQKRLNAGILSAVTFGLMNETAMNQTTHCIYAVGPAAGRVTAYNRSLFGMFLPTLCSGMEKAALGISVKLSRTYGMAQK